MTDPAMVTITAEQREALYEFVLDDLDRLEELRQAWESQDLERCYSVSRPISDGLRLILGGLGWGSQINDPVRLTLPVEELRRILNRLRDKAAAYNDWQQPEREATEAQWQRTVTARDACDEVLKALPSSG